MKLNIYGLRDSVALETIILLTAPSDELMARNAKAMMLQGAQMFLDNVQDKAIFHIGQLDTTSGKVIAAEEPVQVFQCLELFNEAKEERRKIFGDERNIKVQGKEVI